jgi:proline dehydrogenase
MAQRFPPSEVPLGWRFSLTLPSRWKRSQADAQWASEMGVRVRLVKGEFRASSSSGETDPREGFLLLVDRLAGHVPEIAVATHDYPLAREAIARCMRSGTHIELELLFGIPASNMIKLSREMAIPLRFYVPYGDTLLVYGIRHFITYPHKLFRPDSLQVISSSSSKLARILESL